MGKRAYRAWGFESAREYGAALRATPKIVATRAFAPLLPGNALKESGAALKQVLGAFDLVCLGIGMMLGELLSAWVRWRRAGGRRGLCRCQQLGGEGAPAHAASLAGPGTLACSCAAAAEGARPSLCGAHGTRSPLPS